MLDGTSHGRDRSSAIQVICLEEQPEIWEYARRALDDQTGFVLIKNPGGLAELDCLSYRIGPAVLLTSSRFLSELSSAGIRRLWATRNLNVLPILDPTDLDLQERDRSIERYIREGCAGVLDPAERPETCRRAVEAAAAGELWAPRRIIARLLRQLIQLDGNSPRKLTRRELEILELIGLGYKNRDIARLLFISKETVRWHVRSLYSKLGVADREHAVVLWRFTYAQSS